MKREELGYFYATNGKVDTMPLLHNIFVYPKEDVDHLLDEKDAKIESLKAKLEDARATVAFNHLDAVTRERRLRRALWLARALRARDIQRWWIAATCAPATERACSVWNIVERKCLKKAEKYR